MKHNNLLAKMKKNIIILLSATILVSSCDTYTGSGAYAGGTLGSLIGTAIGGIVGGGHGSSVGSLIGLAGGAALGAAAGAAADKRQAQREADDVHEHYERVQQNKARGINPYKENRENNEPETIVLTFSAERPQLEPSTRTAWDSDAKAIVWTNGDKIRAGYTLNGAWMGKTEAGTARFYASTGVDITENESIGTFNVPGDFTDPEADGKYQFFAIYPSSLIESTSVSDPSALTRS